MEILKFLLLSGVVAAAVVTMNFAEGGEQMKARVAEAVHEQRRNFKRALLDSVYGYFHISEQTTFAGVK